MRPRAGDRGRDQRDQQEHDSPDEAPSDEPRPGESSPGNDQRDDRQPDKESPRWDGVPWARRGNLRDRLEAATYREVTQESVFGGYHPDAPTTEMGVIPITAFDQPPPPQPTAPPAPPPQPPPVTDQPPAPPEGPEAPAPTAPSTEAPPAPPPPGAPRPPAPAEAPPPEAPSPPPTRRSSFLVAAGILLSRISGLVRETVMANYLGTTAAADAFRAALRIPNLLQNLLGEGVLSASFIPVYARLHSERDEREAGYLAGTIASLLIALTGVLSMIGLLLARPITSLITPGVGPSTHELTVDLVRIMFPGIGFLVLSAWCLGVLNSHRRFFLSYVAPVLWNSAQIVALVVVAWRTTDDHRSMAVALAWGVLIGGILQLAVQLKPVLGLVSQLRLSFDIKRDSVRDVLRRFGPVLLSRGSVQLLAFFDLVLASWLMAGAIAAMGYAQVLYLLPISLFGMSIAAAELPDLSETRVFDPETRRSFRRRLEDGMARIGFYVAPTATLFVVAGDVVVKALFERGQFTAADTWQVWLVLSAFSLGLPAVTSSRLLINGLFALDDAKTPARLAVIRVLLAAAIGLALMFPLDRLFIGPDGIQGWGDVLGGFSPFPRDVRDTNVIPHLGIVGLAIGSAVAAWVEYLMLSRALAVQVGRTRLAGRWLNPIAASCAAAALVAAGLVVVTGGVDILTGNAVVPSVTRAGLVLGPAGLVYLGMTARLGVPESRALMSRLLR